MLQEVQKIVKTDTKGFNGIAYNKLSAVLIEAVKEQQKQIKSQNRENQQLKSELQSVKEKIEQIEALLAKSGVK